MTRASRRVVSIWRESLQFRTVLITLVLTGTAILLIGLYISFSVSANLFQARLDQVLASSNNATVAAGRIFDSSDAADRAAVGSVFATARSTIASTSSSKVYAIFRVPGQDPSSVAPQDLLTPALAGLITPQLRESVQESPDGQFWQSVQLAAANGRTEPGVIVGSQIMIPSSGHYELYLGYSFAESEATLAFIQATGVLGAVALMVLLSGITLVLVRFVLEPIRNAATTSRRLADGDLAVRLPSRGEDELATLARSFNAMADSLQSQIRELAELSIVQQRFVSDVSHELRTPLTTIRLAGEVLYSHRDAFDAASARTAELLFTQTERFELLLNDLLEISRYDAGSVDLDPEPTHLVHLVEDTVAGMAALAASRGSDLRVVAPGGHVAAEMDPRRVRRVVRNLLGNAIEHGEGAPIVVTVDSNEDAVALAVRDYGVGMTAEAASRVFDRFWRADPSRTRTIGGTGLGLAISLEDAAAHGGTLDVWSLAGSGACFRLTLPRRPHGAIGHSPVSLPPDDAPGTPTGVSELVDAMPNDAGNDEREGSDA